MGSVGANTNNQMNVPYDEWGPELKTEYIYETIDGERTMVGWVEDSTRYVTEHQLTPVTKKEAVDFALEFWDKADGWTVDDDYKIYLAYDDGTFRDVADDPKKGLNRRGLIGVSVSTPDDEIVWGGNNTWHNGHKEFQQWSVHDEDGNEVEGNFHSWYKTTGSYKVRVESRTVKQSGGRYKKQYRTIRKSTVKPWG